MKCKLTGLECVKNNHGYCQVFHCQLPDVTPQQVSICFEHANDGYRSPYMQTSISGVTDPLEHVKIIPDKLPDFVSYGTDRGTEFTAEVQTVFEQAINKFGIMPQVDKLISELSELLFAVTRFKEHKPNNICEEIADVEIMIAQIKTQLPQDELNRWLKFKLQKLEMLVKE